MWLFEIGAVTTTNNIEAAAEARLLRTPLLTSICLTIALMLQQLLPAATGMLKAVGIIHSNKSLAAV
jgi:hypothetical protein